MQQSVSGVLRAISNGLNVPVMIILIILMAATVVLLGTLIVELITEHRHLKVSMPKLIDEIRDSKGNVEECINKSGLLKVQKKILCEVTHHPELTDDMRTAMAAMLLEEEKERLDKRVEVTNLIAKLGPIFGLLGTLIPLGPGIVALGQGDTYTLSNSLLIAFDTTVAGLIAGAVAMVISTVRKKWYRNYNAILDTLMECVLEMEAGDETEEKQA